MNEVYRKIGEAALIGRARRRLRSRYGQILFRRDPKAPDHLLGGDLYAFTVNENDGTVDRYWSFEQFERWCREEGVLKPGERVAEG